MNIFQQVSLASWDALYSLTKMTRPSYHWAAIYSAVGCLVFALLIWLFLQHQAELKSVLLNYLFPQSWQSISESLIRFLYESQTKTVIANLILSSSLVMTSIFLFPIKESFSASFERNAGYSLDKVNEFPLLYQAFEETKLFLVYLTSQLIILWIGYYPYAWTSYLSIFLSYLFLFFTLSLDFIAPTFQRHRKKYASIIKLLLSKPLLSLTFGLIFSLPAILLSQWVVVQPDWGLVKMVSLLFIGNLFLLALAIPAGTHVAVKLFPLIEKINPPSNKNRRLSYAALFSLLFIGLLLHSRLLLSLHHKSQLLKAEYSIDWSSFDYQLPDLNTLTSQAANSKLSFALVIKNPTDFDIEVEQSAILIEQNDNNIATIKIEGFSIPAGQEKRVMLAFNADSNLSLTSQWQGLLSGWRVEWRVEIWPGIPFIVNLVEPSNQ